MILEIDENKIFWLELLNWKLIWDNRWYIWELVEWWINNPFLDWKLWHIYNSVASYKKVPKWWHYHFKNIDRFSVLTWSTLCIFVDYRGKEKKVFAYIAWDKKYENNFWIKNFTIDEWYMITVKVPTEVYHLFIPLTDNKSVIMSLASEKHDDQDYVRIDPFEINEIKNLLSNFEIKW